MLVYLAGPINGCTDDEALGWRREARALLMADILDPMRRDYRGQEAEAAAAIVEQDLEDICNADVLLVNADRPTWGTAMEVFAAHDMGKRVVAFCSGSVSPWLAYHAEVHPTLIDAIMAIGGLDPNRRRDG